MNIEVLFADENIWLAQKKMAELFDCSSDNISLHLKNIYLDKELLENLTTEDFSVVQNEGDREVQRKVRNGVRLIRRRKRRIKTYFKVV